jgi:hypothetical protein
VPGRDEEPYARRRGGDHRGELGLGDRGDGGAVLRVVGELVGGRAGVGGDRDRAERDTGEPGDDELGTVVEVYEHPVAGPDSTCREARRHRC